MDMQIVDAHHHLFDLDNHRYPWLDPGVPSIVGDPSAIRKPYLAADYRRDSKGFDVVATVHLDGGFDPTDPVGETRLAQSVFQRDGFPNAIVGFVPLDSPAAPDLIRAHLAASPLFRGVRQIVAWHRDPRLSYVARNDMLKDSLWLKNFALLKDYDLSFDMQVFPGQMADVAQLARCHPETPIILNQAGMPDGLASGDLGEWTRGMAMLAACHNVSVKISGFGMLDPHWTTQSGRPLIRGIIDLFGPQRTMFASNFPVDKLFRSFAEIYAAYADSVHDLTPGEQHQLFAATATRIYRPAFAAAPLAAIAGTSAKAL